MTYPVSEILGRRFGRLVAQRQVRVPPGYKAWECICDCGQTKAVGAHFLVKGETKSCGCLMRECQSRAGGRVTHGLSRSRAYNAWQQMRARCGNHNNPEFAHYGGRGIRVCDRWQRSFEAFFADMAAPGPGLSLDRVNNNGNYEPSNCRWATLYEQANNKRRSQRLTFGGHTGTVAEWSERTGLHPETIRGRLKRGLPVEAILAPVLRRAS